MSNSGIYKIQSKVKPERIYIGSSIDIIKRWKEHLYHLKYHRHRSIKLQRHYDKYGKNDLIFSIIMNCDKDDLIITEQFFLDSHKTYFNTYKTANSPLGYKHSEETKQKIREYNLRTGRKPPSSLGRKQSDETKQKCREVQLRRWAKPEARLGQIFIHPFKKGNIPWNKGIKGLKTWNKGVPNSEEARSKMKEAWKKRKQDINYKMPIPPTFKNKHHSEETKKKIGASPKGKFKKGQASLWAGQHHSKESNEKNRIAHLGRIPWNKGLKIKKTA